MPNNFCGEYTQFFDTYHYSTALDGRTCPYIGGVHGLQFGVLPEYDLESPNHIPAGLFTDISVQHFVFVGLKSAFGLYTKNILA